MNDTEQDTQKGRKYTSGRQLMIGAAIFVLIFYVIIHIPSYITYQEASYCKKAESDANGIAAEIADYFSISEHALISKADIDYIPSRNNTFTVTATNPSIAIIITVTDGSGKCPKAYQDANIDWDDIGTGWDGNDVYKLTISKP